MAEPSTSEAQEVFQAIKKGDLKRLMEEFPLFDYVNTTDPSVTDTALCFTAIHLAAYLDHVPMVRWLLYKGVGAALKDNQHLKGVLRCGVVGNNSTVIRLLLDAGADINWVDSTGFSALRYASFLGNENAISTMVNYITKEEVAALSMPDGAGGQTTLPTELIEPLRNLIMMTKAHPIRVALYTPPIFFDGNYPEIIDHALKTMRDRKMQNNPRSFDLVMSYKYHFLSCVLNQIKNEDPVPDDSTQIGCFITRASNIKLIDDFFGETFKTFPYSRSKFFNKVVSGLGGPMKVFCNYIDIAEVILEYSCGKMDYPIGVPIDAACKEIMAFDSCNFCGQALHFDEHCEFMHWPEHDDLCEQLTVFEEETVILTPKELQSMMVSQEPEQMTVNEVEETPEEIPSEYTAEEMSIDLNWPSIRELTLEERLTDFSSLLEKTINWKE